MLVKHLDDFRVVAVPDAAKRRHRVLAVGRALLQILAIQHNLEEPLDLNGDAYEDLVNGHIESLSMDGGEAFRAMYMATKPKLLSHAKFWDRAAFVEECGEFIISHELNDGTYRPATYGRVAPPETRRPRIAVEISSDETSKRTSRNRTRRRAEDEGTDEDAPPAKRPAQSNRELRPRNQGVVVYAPVVPPAPPVDEAKITGRGRGWVTMEE
ncbi:hypothetical protein FB45DRAFT_873153 [Roridomyces roridus]|uniref:Uncharacterized protein n=1 Tax=Roridomyces roridus TaxID=1738132 RepID=A0AAD7FFK0_9AGAR|nr:hypothetical protein FB45DRAFT_873153 [Roridomyces roridus]